MIQKIPANLREIADRLERDGYGSFPSDIRFAAALIEQQAQSITNLHRIIEFMTPAFEARQERSVK